MSITHTERCHSRLYLRSPFCTCRPRGRRMKWHWPWTVTTRNRVPDIVATFPYRRREIGLFTQEWLENNALHDIRMRSWREDSVDITGRRISYAWANLDGGHPEDIVTLTVTVHG